MKFFWKRENLRKCTLPIWTNGHHPISLFDRSSESQEISIFFEPKVFNSLHSENFDPCGPILIKVMLLFARENNENAPHEINFTSASGTNCENFDKISSKSGIGGHWATKKWKVRQIVAEEEEGRLQYLQVSNASRSILEFQSLRFSFYSFPLKFV